MPFPPQSCMNTYQSGKSGSTARDLPSTVRSAGASLGPMTETPDEDTARPDEDEGTARDSLAGEIAREIDPDAVGGNGGTPDT